MFLRINYQEGYVSDQEFKNGDVVMLKSGGPDMTISSTNTEYGVLRADCVWFDTEQKLAHASFSVSSLKRIK